MPFKHEVAWNGPDGFWATRPDCPLEMPLAEQDRVMEQWDRELEAHYWNPSVMNGAIPICHLGCAYRHWLVVTGSQRGTIWCDYRADENGLFPLVTEKGTRVIFDEWYGIWLQDPVRAMDAFQKPDPIR